MTRAAAKIRDERGMILVIVLWTIAAMTIVAVALTSYVQRNITTTATDKLQLRSELQLRSGISVGVAILLGIKEKERVFFDGETREIDLGDGRKMSVTINDATARVDLNKADSKFLEGLFIAVLESKGAGREMAEAVMGLRKVAAPDDAKADVGKSKPAPADNRSVGQASRAPPSFPGKRPGAKQDQLGDKPKTPDHVPVFVTTLQLLTLGDLRPAAIQKVIPFVGVASKDGKVNPMTASGIVLAAIPKITDEALKVISQARHQRDVTSEPMKKVLQDFDAFLTVEPPRVYRVTVQITGGSDVIAGSRLIATILLTPEAAKPFQVLALSW